MLLFPLKSLEAFRVGGPLAWRHALCVCVSRAPDIPAGAPLLYQLQLLDVSDKTDPLNLLLADRIRAGNHKRERGNFHFQREEYGMAARAYRMALDVLTTCGGGTANQGSHS